MPVIIAAILNTLPIAFLFALSALFFPQSIFGILTNYDEINQEIFQYINR